MIEFEKDILPQVSLAKIKVLGVGGAGGNTINRMLESKYEGIDFIVANTDAQTLKLSKAPHSIQIGVKSTRGLGAGANPEIGRRAAEEDLIKILDIIGDADVVFLTGGLGGGTGSGALPVIARELRERKILSIAVVTKPFVFEGKRRMRIAQEALEALKREVDTLIVIPNQKLLDVTKQDVSLLNAFSMINDVINAFVRSISDVITKPGHINVDFADVKATMKDAGMAVMGTGRTSGPDRAILAAQHALYSPLLESVNINEARGVLLNITGSSNLGLHEVSSAASIIYEAVHEDANIILGSVIDESLGDEVSVTLVATDFLGRSSVQATASNNNISNNNINNIQAAQHHVINNNLSSSFVLTGSSIKESPVKLSDSIIANEQLPETSSEINDLEVPALVRRTAQKMQGYNNI